MTNPDGIAQAPPPKWPGRLARRLRGNRERAPSLEEHAPRPKPLVPAALPQPVSQPPNATERRHPVSDSYN